MALSLHLAQLKSHDVGNVPSTETRMSLPCTAFTDYRIDHKILRFNVVLKPGQCWLEEAVVSGFIAYGSGMQHLGSSQENLCSKFQLRFTFGNKS